ncbi:GntR family transcriptional regulator [Amedibacillus sp. YH-ame10]
MEREKNLYMYVYRMILTCIYNGTYACHEKLPVLPELCKQYNVGRNTVRSALSELQKDGYVSLQKGVQASVLFDVEDLQGNIQYRQALIDGREMTKDVYETMDLVIPDLFMDCFHSKDMNIDEMKQLVKEFNLDNIKNEAQLIKRMYDIYLYIFNASNNPILVDLFSTLLFYAYQPLIPEKQSYVNLKRSVNGIRKATSIALKFANAKQDSVVKYMIRKMVNMHGENSLHYIDELCNDLTPQHSVPFVWVCNRDQEYLYAKVALNILVSIADKTYNLQDVLPSISALSKQYDVSDRTTRKALEILRYYQVIETVNGIGSRIIKVNFLTDDEILKDEKVKGNLIACSHALQVFASICKAVMPPILKEAKKEEMMEIAKRMEGSVSKTLGLLSAYVFSKTNACLNIISNELYKTLDWSVFVNMFVKNSEQEQLREDLIHALMENDSTHIFQIAMKILETDSLQLTTILQLI